MDYGIYIVNSGKCFIIVVYVVGMKGMKEQIYDILMNSCLKNETIR